MEKKSIVCSVIARAVYKGHGYNLGLPSSIAIANSEFYGSYQALAPEISYLAPTAVP